MVGKCVESKWRLYCLKLWHHTATQVYVEVVTLWFLKKNPYWGSAATQAGWCLQAPLLHFSCRFSWGNEKQATRASVCCLTLFIPPYSPATSWLCLKNMWDVKPSNWAVQETTSPADSGRQSLCSPLPLRVETASHEAVPPSSAAAWIWCLDVF